MAGRQEWQLEKAAAEEEHFQKYGFLSDDYYEDGDFDYDSWGDSWVEDPEEFNVEVTNGGSWDYPDPAPRL